MSLTIVPGLPNGTLICCKQYKGKTFYGTSLGDLLFVEEDGLGECLASGAPSTKRLKFNSPILKIDASQAGLETNLLLSTKNGLYLTQLPELGSLLRAPKTTPLKTVADCISIHKSGFVWCSAQVIYYGELTSAGLRSRKLSHVKSHVVQLEMSPSYDILICTYESILLSKRNEPVEIIAEVPQFSATITGACFDRNANVIFTDTSGCIRMINQEGEALWETTMGYQSGFRPGNLLYLSTRILSYTASSLCAVNILESDFPPVLYSISGSVQDVSSYGGSEFIVISGGKAMKSIAARKSVHRPEPKPRIEEPETVDLDKAFSAARGFFSQIKRQVSKSKQPVFNKVKQVTESLSREIRREIFDDEIFINESSEKEAEKAGQINEGEKERSKLNTPSPTPLDTDTLIIERKIKPQIKKKKKEKNEIHCIPPHESPVSQGAEKQLPIIGKSTTNINQREINAQEIAEAINKACSKVDEENSTESSTSSQSQFTIPIITSALSSSSLSTPKSSSPSDSWIIIDDEHPAAAESSSPSEYDEVINSCYDEI